MNNTKKTVAEIIRNLRNYHEKPMQIFEIDGRKVKTNLGDGAAYWDGNDTPKKYSCFTVTFGKSTDEVFNELIEKGFNEIRIVGTSTRVRGYHNIYIWARKNPNL